MERKDDRDFKIIALTRTDIFLNSNLVNVTSCINDNCLELDWTYSNEKEFKFSHLYRMMNRVLGWDGKSSDCPVETFLSFDTNVFSKRPLKASMYIQRQSRQRPRDIVVLLRLIQKECKKRGFSNPTAEVFSAQSFITEYSNYYTDQVKSEMMFQYSSDTIKDIFQLVKSARTEVFGEAEFRKVFTLYIEQNPHFLYTFKDSRSVLDMLYSLDIVGWRERYIGQVKMHWHYREVKAIDETHRLPWEQIARAKEVCFLIHKGAAKHLLGSIR